MYFYALMYQNMPKMQSTWTYYYSIFPACHRSLRLKSCLINCVHQEQFYSCGQYLQHSFLVQPCYFEQARPVLLQKEGNNVAIMWGRMLRANSIASVWDLLYSTILFGFYQTTFRWLFYQFVIYSCVDPLHYLAILQKGYNLSNLTRIPIDLISQV